MDATRIKSIVRDRYARAACGESACCADPQAIGYASGDLATVPAEVRGSSLGCGSPVGAAALRPGERVLDLGSGAGLDLLLAGKAVGPRGLVYGVDMTPEMVERSRATVARQGLANVAVLRGEIEALPLADACVDAVISNCVINLSPDKPRVFHEAFRVLAPGGRFVVADMLATGPLPPSVTESAEAWGACIAGAIPQEDYTRALRDAGFEDVEVRPEPGSASSCSAAPDWSCCGGGSPPEPHVFSAIVTARRGRPCREPPR